MNMKKNMKKLVLALALSAVVLTGCSSQEKAETKQKTEQVTSEAEEKAEEVKDEAEEKADEVENKAEKKADEIENKAENATDSKTTKQDVLAVKMNMNDAAKAFAEKYPSAAITQLELKNEMSNWQYEMEGQTADKDFELVIDANTGEIIDQEEDADNDDKEEALDLDKYVDINKVLDLSEEQGVKKFESISLVRNDNGKAVWEVEDAETGNEYAFDAESGELVKEDLD